MPYQITLPDGSIGMIDDSVPRNRAMEAAEAAYPDAFPGIGEQLLGAPAELAKGFARGFVDPISGLLSTGYTGLRAAGVEMDPFAETAVGKGLAGIQESLAPGYGTISQFTGAVGGLGSFLVPGVALAKGVGRATTLGGMATGLGAEEARGRVEEARAEGIEVTPGQEFTAQLGGTAIGLTELAPIERLTGPLQAVLRGVKKSDAEMIAPGLFNSAKRIVETMGIEGLQEGMANVAQDLLAKGIYNPNLEVGDSALGDAAMGASVGAFAQGAIELVTRGRRKSLYESLKTEEEQKTRDAEAEKARLAKETARKQTLTNFGVEGQPLLLAAPQGQITPSRQEKSSLDQYGVEDKDLFEPYGTFTRDELDKDVVKELDKRRDEAGRPKTETFTLQDIADTGVYRGELNRLIAQRSGYTGETKFKPSEVVGLAEQKNIDTSTQGFSDFVGRVTGKKPLPEKTGLGALQGLNDVEIFAVREAINKLPTYEQRKILPAGKAAKIFDDKQATRTLTNIKKTLGQDLGEKGLGETSVLKEIGDFSGLKDVNDQQSLLEKYILDGELERVSTPAFAVLDADGKQISVVGPDAGGRLTDIERRKAQEKAEKTLKPGFAVLDAKGKQVDVDVDQGKAQQKAARIGGTIQETTISGSVKDTTINQIRTPDPINRLIGGFDIRQGTFEDTLIDGYDITTETGEVISKTKSLTDAENRANRATELRKQRQLQLLDAKQKIQENIAKSEQAMADLEALGKKDSEDFKKIQNSMAAQERNLAKVEQNLIEFGKKVAFKSRYKQQKRTGFTLFEGNKPVGTYNSRQEALEASVVSQPTDRLEAMLEAFPTLSASAKPGMDRADIKKLQQVAASELASRKGEIPSGVGITVEGDITAAEERLALQGIFSPRIKERVNELDKKLRAALDKLGLKDVRLNIVGAIKGELGDADGVYAARLIKIALDAENPMRVLRHEGIHALKELGAFTPDQWRVLENKAKSEWMAKYNIADPKRYGSLSPEIQLEEAIAEAFADFSQTKPPAGLIGNVFSRIKSFFAALDNGFKGLGFQTADDVFGRVDRGELLPGMGERAAEVQGLQAQRVVAETPERYALKTVQDVIDDGINRLVKSVLQPSVPSGFKSLVNDRVSFRKVDANLEKIEDGIMNRLQGFGMTNSEAFNILYNDIRYVADQKFQEIREQEYQARREARQSPERYSLSTQNPDQQYSVRQAPPDVLEEAQRYYEANGILPYTQETITSVGVETKPEKFSLKREGKYGNHDVLGIPVNKNGTVTLYFPADNDIAREVMRSRKLVPTEGTDRIYLTNESSAKTVLGNPGNISQQVGGANVLVQIDPGMLQIDQEYEDGRIDFFIPVKEGKAFFDKMKLTRLFTVEGARNKGFNTDRTLNQVGDSIVSAVDSYMSANAKGRQAIVKQARDVLREQHNIGTLLGENGKLEKTRIGDYGLTYEGQSVASLGLGLASAQRLNTQERVTTCPKSAICEGLCLGDTSGQNQLYGGEDQFRQGPRLSQYLKTEALMLNPEAFGVLLSHEIQSFVNKTKAMDYQPAIRLNVTSDIPPKVYKAIIDAFPNVMFYDYTKLFGNKSIAPNHHLTYSSSGASQRVGNELIVNKLSTWDKDVQKLLGGDNVAMAFTSRKSMPKTVRDEKTGENFEVWNGDNYDARFLDPKRDDGKGYIIGLTNKDRTVKPEEAAKQYDGFFMDYDPKRDGDTLIIKDQARLNAQATQPIQIVRPKERYSLRGANTPEFREWFGNSTIVNEQGSPRVMYHGTARDITEFKAKQAGAIFVTEDPRFAEDFGIQSETWMIDHADQFLPEQELKKAIALGVTKMTPGMSKQKRTEMLAEMLKFPTMSIIRDPDATKIRDVVLNKMPSRQNILPVYVRSENPFDYQNPEDVQGVIDYIEENVLFSEIYEAFNRDLDITDDLRSELESGRWASIENPIVQEAIRENRHDGFYIREGGRKNLAVYDPNQLKSVTGNIGTYGQREPTEAEAADFGMTKEEASAAQKRGDLRYSLRSKTPPPQNIQKFFDQAERLETTSDISDLRDAWIGGVSDSGLNEAAYYINDVPGGKDYTKNVQKLAKQMLGNRIKGFRLMSTEELENIRAGDLSYYAAFTLDPNTALSFANFVQNRKIAPKNLVVVEADINPGDIHMIGKDAESEVVVDMFKLGDQKVQEFAQPVRYSLRNTDTPAFKQWFKDSKVVDKKGDPLVVYHGTAYDFSEFSPERLGSNTGAPSARAGFFFTARPKTAEYYAKGQFPNLESAAKAKRQIAYVYDTPTGEYQEGARVIDIKFSEEGTTPNIMPVYLSLQNPLTYDFKNKVYRDKKYWELIDQAKKEGRDGVILKNTYDSGEYSRFDAIIRGRFKGEDIYIIFEPTQIKSAIGNIGTFDPTKPDIRYSLRQTNTPAFKQWFGDSKVAGSDGKPTVVYTGTSKDVDFSTFKVPKSGVWFTESQEGASQYALENDSMTIKTEDYRTFQEINTASRVIPAYLRIDNPAKLSKEESDSIRYAKNYRKAQGDLFDRLRSRGHDGVEIGDGTWVVLKSPNQIKSAIGNTGEFSAVKSDIRYSLRQQAGQTLGQSYLNTVQRTTTPRVEKGFKDRISEAMSATPFAKFRQMFINKYERIEYFSKQLAKQFGDAVLLADQSAIAAALMSDRAAGVAAESFKSGIPVYAKGYTYVDNMGGKVKGLMEILMPLAQKQDPFVYQMYQDYAARRRGVRLDSEGKITPFTRQELSEIPNIEKAFPEFKQVFEDYQRYNEGLVRYMRDTGVIDAKAAQEWMRYGDYVPFYRQLEGESTVGPSIFSAISGVKAPKKLKGGDAPLGEFLETVVRNSRAAIEAGMRNVAANRVVNNFQRLNSPSTGGRLVEKTSEQNKNRPDVVTVRENGKDAYYKVADPLLVQSLQALNIPQIPGLDILAKPAEFLREMVTRDPAFIGASVLRESLSAWITTGQKLTPVASGVNQFVKILANASPTVQALRRAGIGSGYEFKGDVQATAGVFGDQLKRMAGEMTAAQKAVMPLRAMWDSLDKASTAADLSTRAAVFERVMQETGNEAEAIYQAMEVINFSRKGSSPIIQIFAAIIPFLNARIQGLDLLYRAGFGELASATRVAQQKAFMLRSLALLGTTAMYYALVQDEEEWQRADQETRDNYWIIGNMKFPIPFELGVMFKVLPERIMAYTMGEDTGEQVRASIARQVLGTLSFNPIPQAVLPLIEASSNYSFFLQRDIVGMGKKDLAPEFQTSEGTSQIAIQLGQTLGISPMKIDYVIRGYTGAMGTYAISTMDSIIRSEDDATKATWRLDQIPVLKRFMISDLGAGTVNEYYDLREKLDEVVRTSNQLERTGNIEALQDYLKENGQVLGMKDYIRSLDKDMKSLRESRMAINMSRMEPDQKREALDSLRRAEISLTERIGLLRSNLGV
jgi:hypothetical protein